MTWERIKKDFADSVETDDNRQGRALGVWNYRTQLGRKVSFYWISTFMPSSPFAIFTNFKMKKL